MTKEEAIKLVKERVWLESGRPVSDALEMLIPELGESDDERVRKGLINFLQSPFIKENLTDEKVAPWIAYLEQQKEQKLIEWSEEDETHRAFILELLEDYIRFCKKDAEGAYYTKQIRTAQNWLKSLRPPQDRCEDCPHRGDMFLLTQGIKSGKHNLAVTFMNYMDENRTEWQKQQMLKEAVEGYVTFNCDLEEEGLPCVTVIANEKPLEFYKSRGFKLGDKVKIVIVSEKEDSK